MMGKIKKKSIGLRNTGWQRYCTRVMRTQKENKIFSWGKTTRAEQKCSEEKAFILEDTYFLLLKELISGEIVFTEGETDKRTENTAFVTLRSQRLREIKDLFLIKQPFLFKPMVLWTMSTGYVRILKNRKIFGICLYKTQNWFPKNCFNIKDKFIL